MNNQISLIDNGNTSFSKHPWFFFHLFNHSRLMSFVSLLSVLLTLSIFFFVHYKVLLKLFMILCFLFPLLLSYFLLGLNLGILVFFYFNFTSLTVICSNLFIFSLFFAFLISVVLDSLFFLAYHIVLGDELSLQKTNDLIVSLSKNVRLVYFRIETITHNVLVFEIIRAVEQGISLLVNFLFQLDVSILNLPQLQFLEVLFLFFTGNFLIIHCSLSLSFFSLLCHLL